MSDPEEVAILGCGRIAQQWILIFTSFGYKVNWYAENANHLSYALSTIGNTILRARVARTLRGKASVNERMELISTTVVLRQAIKKAKHIQDCTGLDSDRLLEAQEMFKRVDMLLADNNSCAICSSATDVKPSDIFAKVKKHKDQCLVAHPMDPTDDIRLVELVPHKGTRADIVKATRELMEEIGQVPVVLKKEISGNAANRLHYLISLEAYRLVRDGVMSPEDVERVFTDGLGPMYAFLGPWTRNHMEWIANEADKYKAIIHAIRDECREPVEISGQTESEVMAAMFNILPAEEIWPFHNTLDKSYKKLDKLKH